MTAASTANQPLGAKPPWEYRLAKVGPVSEWNPKACAPPIRMNEMMAATLIEANQNSNSP